MAEVQQCIHSKKKEFKEFVTRKIQEVLSVNNNTILTDPSIKPLSVSIMLKIYFIALSLLYSLIK